MIGSSVFVNLALMTAVSIIFPVILAIWWIKARKEKVSTVIIGAATWFVFAIVLESIPKSILFNPALPTGKAVMGNAVLYTVFGCLLAGIFEETGRFVVFKTLLKNRTNKETAISHGIGHGGFEAIFMMGITGIQYMVYASMINSGTFNELIEQAKAMGTDTSAMEKLPEQIMSFTIGNVFLNVSERVFAVLLHIGLSILVFYAVKRSKIQLYILSVALHALFDVPAALYQFGIIKELYIVEIIFAVYATVFFILMIKQFYKKDDNHADIVIPGYVSEE